MATNESRTLIRCDTMLSLEREAQHFPINGLGNFGKLVSYATQRKINKKKNNMKPLIEFDITLKHFLERRILSLKSWSVSTEQKPAMNNNNKR
ncbi:hypothetical protein BLOT_004807 [Blomia tropicalis]|nr:hypothetical protein BLOT_004807 [Blomia tropicalis]